MMARHRIKVEKSVTGKEHHEINEGISNRGDTA